jgi:tetratricopeptide (TPR) repeat protein
VFSKESSKAISDGHVAVRLTGGNDITPEVRTFMDRYKVRGYPTLFVMNVDGHVVVPQVGRSLEAIQGALAKGERREAEFAALAARTDGTSVARRGKMLVERMMWDEALPLLTDAMAKSPSDETAEALFSLHAAKGEREAGKALLEKSLTDFPQSSWRGVWRVRLATAELEAGPQPRSQQAFQERAQQTADALKALVEAAEKDKDAVVAADARLALGNALWMAGKAEDSVAAFEAVLAAKSPAAPSRVAAGALMGLANARWRAQDFEGCISFLERIVAEHPDSDEAQNAPAGIDNCKKRIAAKSGSGPGDGAAPGGGGK